MIRRQTAKTLAEAYHEKFRGSVTTSTVYGPPRGAYRLQVDRLYDFLYEHEYEAWFLNAAKALRTTDVRALKEFIMRLHTGKVLCQSRKTGRGNSAPSWVKGSCVTSQRTFWLCCRRLTDSARVQP